MTRFTNNLRRFGLPAIAAFTLLAASPAQAVDLPFSVDCRQFSAIAVAAPNTGILFRKNPNSAATRAATATVFAITAAENIEIPTGGASCFFQVLGNDSYCFLARGSDQIVNVNAVAGNNHLGAPACQ